MEIIKKMALKARANFDNSGVTIAFLGDSVTQGCFELYRKSDSDFDTVFDKSAAYHKYISDIFTVLFPTVPVNIINAGISGDNAPHAVTRLERDVLKYSPDLTVVCFGLNDSGQGLEKIPDYVNALKYIFQALKANGGEIIFMTPNMMNTGISCHITDEIFKKCAEDCMKTQNNQILRQYLDAAKNLCKEMGIVVCDCYQKWETLYNNGVDVTELLSNKINHPTREMNRLFAYSLVETMFNN